jgi:hypothetical protein
MLCHYTVVVEYRLQSIMDGLFTSLSSTLYDEIVLDQSQRLSFNLDCSFKLLLSLARTALQ